MISMMKITEGLADSRGTVHWLVATLLAVCTTFALVRLGADPTAAGMVYLVLVVWSATQAGVWLSLYVAFLSAVGFDYYFLPPVGSFQLHGVRSWVAMLSYMASCLVVSRVAERARRQTSQAESRREDVERLYELSQEMMLHEEAAALIRDLPRLIHRIFALDRVVLYVSEANRFMGSNSEVSAEEEAALGALSHGQNPTMRTNVDFQSIALTLGMRPLGALGWRPDRLSREVASAMSAQVAIALARSMAIEQTARIEAAREGERLRTALIDSLTHELRTPLTSIRAAATTLLEARGLDEAGRLDLAAIVDEEASRLDALIGEAVEMAQIDANTVELHVLPEHPRALLEHAIEESRKALAGHRVSLDVQGEWVAGSQIGADDPVLFDSHLLGRVLRHLLENAARHTPPGSRIEVRSWRTQGRLEFSVADDGPGIDPTDLPFIFEKFYRGKKNVQMGKGSGMGLAIARAILLVHGGGIEASNVSPSGARFHFWVPLEERDRQTHPGSAAL
jgi:two-component system sensor histidine kinase KdpD